MDNTFNVNRNISINITMESRKYYKYAIKHRRGVLNALSDDLLLFSQHNRSYSLQEGYYGNHGVKFVSWMDINWLGYRFSLGIEKRLTRTIKV